VPAHQVQQAMRQAEIETIIGVKDVVRLSIVHIVKGGGLGLSARNPSVAVQEEAEILIRSQPGHRTPRT
jgi:hypothetical protein